MVKLSSFRSTMKFKSLLNNFLTSGIKTAAPEIIKKIRVLNLLELVFVISSFFLGLFYFYIGAVSLFYACMIAGFMGLSTIPLLRMTHNTMLIHDTAGELRECRVISTNITNLKIKIKKMERDTAKNNAKLSSLNNEYNLLKKNIAGFLRKKKN